MSFKAMVTLVLKDRKLCAVWKDRNRTSGKLVKLGDRSLYSVTLKHPLLISFD